MKRALLAIGLLASACKKDGGGAPAVGSGSASASSAISASCNDAINKSVDGMIAKKQSQGGDQFTPDRRERMEKLRGALGTRCAEDKWPDAMLTCVSAATGQPELMRCMHDNLDAGAARHLQADIGQVMFGMRRNGAGGPGQGPDPTNFHPRTHDFDVAGAFEKRIAEVATKLGDATKALAAATTDADKATAKADVERLTREQAELQRQLVQIKATHGGDLKDSKPSTTVPGPSPRTKSL